MANISVTWSNGQPSAPDLTVKGRNATVITWVPDGTVNITGITTPSDGSHNDFTAPAQLGNSSNWQCTDSCANDGDYDYTISGTEKVRGAEASHDPQIRNDREG